MSDCCETRPDRRDELSQQRNPILGRANRTEYIEIGPAGVRFVPPNQRAVVLEDEQGIEPRRDRTVLVTERIREGDAGDHRVAHEVPRSATRSRRTEKDDGRREAFGDRAAHEGLLYSARDPPRHG